MTVQATQTSQHPTSIKMMGESEQRSPAWARGTTIDTAANIAKRIRFLRETSGLSRPKFAALLGNMPMTTLKNYELGYREPGLAVIQQITGIFGPGTLVWLITGNGGISEEAVKHTVSLHDVGHVVG